MKYNKYSDFEEIDFEIYGFEKMKRSGKREMSSSINTHKFNKKNKTNRRRNKFEDF